MRVAVIDGPIGDELLAKVSASPAKLVAIGWMGRRRPQPLHQKARSHSCGSEGAEGAHDGQPAVCGHHECHGRQWHSRWIWRGVHRTANRCGGWRRNNAPSYFTSNHYNTGAKYYTQTNHLIIPELLVVSQGHLGQTLQGRSGPAQEVRARSPDGAAGPWDKSVAENTAKL